MTNGNGNGSVLKTAVTTIGDNLKGNPLAFALVVINFVFVGLVLFLLWHVSAGLERRDQIIKDFITRCVAQKTGMMHEDRNIGWPWIAGEGRIVDPR